MLRDSRSGAALLTSEDITSSTWAPYFHVPDVPGIFSEQGYHTFARQEIARRAQELGRLNKVLDLGLSAPKKQLKELYDTSWDLVGDVLEGVQQRTPFLPLENAAAALADFGNTTSSPATTVRTYHASQ